jgi:hypothetical protein
LNKFHQNPIIFTDHTQEQAFADISNTVKEICESLKNRGMVARLKPGEKEIESKIFIKEDGIDVKVEINHVMRGVVSTFKATSITQAVKDRFKTNITVPMLSEDEIYAGKLVAAMSRQHPRDLFDVYQLMEHEGITAEMVNIFVAYLSCHNRPIHEVLFGNMLNIDYKYLNIQGEFF